MRSVSFLVAQLCVSVVLVNQKVAVPQFENCWNTPLPVIILSVIYFTDTCGQLNGFILALYLSVVYTYTLPHVTQHKDNSEFGQINLPSLNNPTKTITQPTRKHNKTA
jgi:hypothetical protein